MTRILLLHAQLGSGHRSAAEALALALRARGGVEARVEDALDHIYPVARTLWVRAYKRMSERAHALYRAFYAASDADDARDAAAANLRAGRLSRIFFARIDRLIASYRPDAVVCTMQFPLQLMSHMRHEGSLAAPLYVVVTDFVPHGSWVAAGVGAYFVPSEATAAGFVRKGVVPELLHVTGTPLRPEVAEPKSVAAARAKLGLPSERPTVAIFGGGLDPQMLRGIVVAFLEAGAPCTVATVAGRNAELGAALEDLDGTTAIALERYGAVDFVDDILAASDLLVGKAGGMITSEALARGTPMVLIRPLPGQEEWNADFVVGAGAGVLLCTPEAVAPTALELLADGERLGAMRARALELGRPDAARVIAATILAGLGVEERARSAAA